MNTPLFMLKNMIAPKDDRLQSGPPGPPGGSEELNGPATSMSWEGIQSEREVAL